MPETWAITCNNKILAVCDDPETGEAYVQSLHSMPMSWTENHFAWDGDLENPKTYRIVLVPMLTKKMVA